MALSFIGQGQDGSAGSWSTAPIAGDLGVAGVVQSTNSGSAPTATGWTQIATVVHANGSRETVFWRILTATAADTFTPTVSGTTTTVVAAYRGASSTTPIASSNTATGGAVGA